LSADCPAGHGRATAHQRPQGGTGGDSGEHRQRFVSLLFLIPVSQIPEDIHFVCPLSGALLQHR
jgi:hypothetical protein